jgi:hypothetical protein
MTTVTFRYKIDPQTILGVTANNDNESGTATSRRVAKESLTPLPFFLVITCFQNLCGGNIHIMSRCSEFASSLK